MEGLGVVERMSAGALVLCMLGLMSGAEGATLTVVNRCSYTVWPAIQTTSSGHEVLSGGGFALGAGQSSSIGNVADTWAGRLWGRTGCSFDSAGHGSCVTGDCPGSGLQCNGNGYQPPVTLAELNLGGAYGRTFYDISAVDGFNVPISLYPTTGGSSDANNYDCGRPSCTADVNGQCPQELRQTSAGSVVACKSACVAFQQPQYCCTQDHNTASTCSSTNYSQFFKNLCPTAYSYAFDDATSTFSCAPKDFTISFCA